MFVVAARVYSLEFLIFFIYLPYSFIEFVNQTNPALTQDDETASDYNACQLLHDTDEPCTSRSITGNISEPNRLIKRTDNSPNLKQYFNDALENHVEQNKTPNPDVFTPMTPIDIPRIDKARDTRSTTVYSRTDSEASSNITYNKSISRDSGLYSDCDYKRTDSCNSFIQDELDSEEYHHDHRFSMTAEALEYIRGRDDWRDYTENKLNNRYRRQSSNIHILEEIDSDEYHHDRKLSDLIDIAYLDAEGIQTLPSSYDGSKMFDRYYIELKQIERQLSNDIEQNVAQKQVMLLDSSETEATEGYMYPLPDIILDQASDYGDGPVEQVDSDYSNVSESEDDIQSVVEVTHGGSLKGELITTLDVDGDVDEMIEVTLWDLNDDRSRELSSRESSVEIIEIENLAEDLTIKKQSETILVSGDNETSILNDITASQRLINAEKSAIENVASSTDVSDAVSSTAINDQTVSKATVDHTSQVIKEITNEGESTDQNKISNTMPQTVQNSNSSTEIKAGSSNAPQVSSVQKSIAINSHANRPPKKTTKPIQPLSEVDQLIKDGCMGVWFH